MADEETTVTIERDNDLTQAQQIRCYALEYLIQLEGAPVMKNLADFKEMCSDAAQWIETGTWPEKPSAKLKKIEGGKGAPQAQTGQ